MKAGDIISYNEMCMAEGYSLQRGMNFKVGGKSTVILMSVRKGAPYADKIEENGAVLLYEGHNVPSNLAANPKNVNQPLKTPSGLLTQNGKFFEAATDYKLRKSAACLVKVYEKIKKGIWVYNGVFELVDAWQEKAGRRKVFKFKLLITDITTSKSKKKIKVVDVEHNRIIPTSVKLEVWKRDKGKCVKCGRTDNLHFDHVLPFSKGGTSLTAKNIQLLCVRHNLNKGGRIQ